MNVYKATSNGTTFKHEVAGFTGTMYQYHTKYVRYMILYTKLTKPRPSARCPCKSSQSAILGGLLVAVSPRRPTFTLQTNESSGCNTRKWNVLQDS
jgi:hypothetical protein